MRSESAIDLYWLPLGAGGRSVKWNGRAYERVCATFQRRAPTELFHSALIVTLPPDEFVIEMAPVWQLPDANREVVATGPVGARWAGRFPLFRYEVHCWRNGLIPDIAEAVESPIRLSTDASVCALLMEQITRVPIQTWGRDELDVGEMWNSNSVIAWVLATSGIDVAAIDPPAGASAPGWDAGVTVAQRRA